VKGILPQYGGENCVLDDSYFVFFYMATQVGPSASIYRDFRISPCVFLVEFPHTGFSVEKGNFQRSELNPWPDRNLKTSSLLIGS
jgi:hypothetical protein